MLKKYISYYKHRILWLIKLLFIQRRFKDNSNKRVIYTITPPPRLSNLGDQAQVVAIYDWIQRNYPGYEVIELNKDEVINCIPKLKSKIRDDDLILLHSGGNMGDRGMWSETSRRMVVENLPNNKILSLPQTINFRPTEKGQKELGISKSIYNAHENLTIVGRDNESYELAKKYFDKCKTDKAPDFVLSYNTEHLNLDNSSSNGKVLVCLREDDESAIDASQRVSLLSRLGREYDVFDTTIKERITEKQRKNKLDETLLMFSKYDCVVTDRFHGLIFSVLCRKPTVVLKTVDHKLTSAFDWFDGVNFVKFSDSIEDVNKTLESVTQESSRDVPAWNKLYFDPLTKYL